MKLVVQALTRIEIVGEGATEYTECTESADAKAKEKTGDQAPTEPISSSRAISVGTVKLLADEEQITAMSVGLGEPTSTSTPTSTPTSTSTSRSLARACATSVALEWTKLSCRRCLVEGADGITLIPFECVEVCSQVPSPTVTLNSTLIKDKIHKKKKRGKLIWITLP